MGITSIFLGKSKRAIETDKDIESRRKIRGGMKMNKRDFTFQAVILGILLLCLISGCVGAGKNVLPSPDSGETTGLPPSDPYQPPAQAKAGNFTIILKKGWNLIKYTPAAPRKFTAVTMAYNGETKLLKDAVPGWTHNKIRYLRGRAIQQIDTNSIAASFLTGGQYYVYSVYNGINLYSNRPFLSGISPAIGPPGTTVTIDGVNFGSSGTLTFFDNKPAGSTAWSDTQIICTVPEGAGSGPVSVTSAGGESHNVSFTIRYIGDFYVDAAIGNDGNDGSLQHPFQSITRALTAASSGQVIMVAEGIYNTSLPGQTFPLNGKDGVALRGGFNAAFDERDAAAHPTVLEASGSTSVAVFSSTNSAGTEISGFTLRGGRAARGGGILCTQASPLVSDCTITGNYATDNYGGGMHCESASPIVRRCKFISNTVSGSWGGAGGGFSCRASSSPILSGCLFSTNSTKYGCGVYMESSTPTMVNCLIVQNTTTAAGYGGGIYFSGGTSTLINCTVARNSANLGGGIYSGDSGGAVIANCIVAYNQAQTSGGGFHLNYTPRPVITYTTFYGNTPYDAYDFGKGTGGPANFAAWGWNGTACLSGNPSFLDSGSDFRLQSGSPCIDVGNNASIPGGTSTDMDGNPRIVNSIVDMGAYEKQ
jgi:hypothetical protein